MLTAKASFVLSPLKAAVLSEAAAEENGSTQNL